MTALRLNFRVWWTGPGLPAAAGMAALVVAAAILTVAASIRTGIPIVNITGVMLLVLALGGSYVTTLLLPRRRPVVGRAAGRAMRPAAANRVPPPAAAGPAYRIGRATVPGGVR